MINYYEILGVSSRASQDEIKRSFRRLAVQYHPDKNQGSNWAEQQFKKVNSAYQILSDPSKRRNYDIKLYYAEQARLANYQNTTSSTSSSKTYTSGSSYANTKKSSSSGQSKTYRSDNVYRDYSSSYAQLRSNSILNVNTRQWITIFSIAAFIVYGIIGIAEYSVTTEKREKEAQVQWVNETNLAIAEALNREEYDFAHALLEQEGYRQSTLYELSKTQFRSELEIRARQHLESNNYEGFMKVERFNSSHNNVYSISVQKMAADVFIQNNQLAKAKNALTTVLNNGDRDYDLLLRIAVLEKQLGELDAAYGHISESADFLFTGYRKRFGPMFLFSLGTVSLPQQHYELFIEKGLLEMEMGYYNKAIDSFDIAIVINKKDPRAYYQRSLSYEKENELLMACYDARRAVELGMEEAQVQVTKHCP